MAPEVVALIPVKALAEAKGRLASVLAPLDRQALTLLCLHQVLQAVQGSQSVTQALVIGSDDAVHRVAHEQGVDWLADPGWDLNESLREGFAHVFRGGADGCLFLPADLPLVTSQEVDRVVGASLDLSQLVLAPAHDGGTNAILLPRGMSFQPHMGVGSLALHLEEAQRTGSTTAVEHSPGLAFDVDTPQDLQRLQEQLPSLIDELVKWHTFLETRPAALPTQDKTPSKVEM